MFLDNSFCMIILQKLSKLFHWNHFRSVREKSWTKGFHLNNKLSSSHVRCSLRIMSWKEVDMRRRRWTSPVVQHIPKTKYLCLYASFDFINRFTLLHATRHELSELLVNHRASMDANAAHLQACRNSFFALANGQKSARLMKHVSTKISNL